MKSSINPTADFQRLIGRTISDSLFRAQLLRAPAETIQAAGFRLSGKELEQVRALAERAQPEAFDKDSGSIQAMW